MNSRPKAITTFKADRSIQPIYTGGDAGLSSNGQVLVTCLGEEALLTDLNTGQLLARVEGVRCLSIFCMRPFAEDDHRMERS